jgi:hypothetical protein
MVKGGEANVTTKEERADRYLAHDSRPRCICVPVGTGYSTCAAVQSQIFESLRAADPSFIHAMNNEQICEMMNNSGLKDPFCVSLDGSAFDSTQHLELME